jgi:hypothetical protein
VKVIVTPELKAELLEALRAEFDLNWKGCHEVPAESQRTFHLALANLQALGVGQELPWQPENLDEESVEWDAHPRSVYEFFRG